VTSCGKLFQSLLPATVCSNTAEIHPCGPSINWSASGKSRFVEQNPEVEIALVVVVVAAVMVSHSSFNSSTVVLLLPLLRLLLKQAKTASDTFAGIKGRIDINKYYYYELS